MATTEALSHDAGHHDDHHDHPAFLAHHFDTPEQQYDSGKLGMWLFLVTEVLFFGGLFCAYVIYRVMRPEVFAGCSVFLNTQLGAINTGVLLFSSLTMAWAVRCAQLEQHKMLTGMLAATLSCASVFLGVKAVEYSHKFGMGLLPAGWYHYDPAAPHDGTVYLVWISIPFALAAIGLVVWYTIACLQRNKFQMRVSGPLIVVGLCYFLGVGLGTILESGHSDDTHVGEAAEHVAAEHADQSVVGVADLGPESASAAEVTGLPGPVAPHAPGPVVDLPAADAEAADYSAPGVNRFAQEATNTGVRQQLLAEQRQQALASGNADAATVNAAVVTRAEPNVNTARRAGVFFSIYYCMTGIHAIHILAGMGVLTWLLVRSVRREFSAQYFGPVDYVGLYWHIVDLIWIYLFPLLYLIR